jgi:membrane protein DedA with SNARE-associated domain
MPADINIEMIITVAGYFGIFALMIANGALSFPSSQVLYVIAGYFIAQEKLLLIPVLLVGALGNTVGNVILYELARKYGKSFIIKLKLFPSRELEKVEMAFQKKGAWFIFIGKLLPAIKVFVPIPAGLGKMHRGFFALLMFIASSIWALGFIALGYFFGGTFKIFGPYALIPIAIAIIVVALFYRYLNSNEILNELKKEE